jgi:hypothetical protein
MCIGNFVRFVDDTLQFQVVLVCPSVVKACSPTLSICMAPGWPESVHLTMTDVETKAYKNIIQ